MQDFERSDGEVIRRVRLGGELHETRVHDQADPELSSEAAWWQSVLRGSRVETRTKGRGPIRVVDAFCGSGGLGLGVKLAAEAVGQSVVFPAIIDTDADALAIHKHNLGALRTISASAASLVDFHVVGSGEDSRFAYAPESVHSALEGIGAVDLFVAGPPCQGHSNLNNHTRRQDPRNDLYVTAVAIGVSLSAEAIIIENVPTVLNSHSDVVATAISLLRASGYSVSMSIIKADELGAAQRRARHFLLAVRNSSLTEDFLQLHSIRLGAASMPLSWAIGDLIDRTSSAIFDSPPVITPVNVARIDYLFDNDIHDLPDDQRPDCHKNGTTYTSVYGRMHWDKPAQTITTGFGTPGQGRYVHPHRRRLVTPREAARIQGFPDWFDFTPPEMPVKRKNLAKWIGDAVHPILGYAVTLAALSAIYASAVQVEAA